MKLFIINQIKLGKTIVALLVLLTFTISSCKDDFLDTAPITSVSSASAFDSPDRVLAQVYGIYASAKDAGLFGGRYFIDQELRANEFLMNKPNVQTGQLTWSQAVSSSTQEVTALWSGAYATINRVNVFLDGLEANKDKVDATLYANYSGEAKVVRAMCYLALVQTYCRPYVENSGASAGLPLRLIAERSTADNQLARSTVAQIYDQILLDLNDAEASLPLSYTTATTSSTVTVLNSTRAHRNTAIAVKTRVYLVMGNYAKVVEEAKKIAVGTTTFSAPSGVANKLETNVTTVFAGTYSGPESLLTFPFTQGDSPAGQNALCYFFTASPGNAEFYLNTSATAADPVFASSSTDARKAFVVVQSGNSWMQKFKTATTYGDYIPVVRYAETLLNYAEAAARTGDLTTSLNLLNAVRKRSNAAYTFPAASVNTQAALINTILQERKIELIGEGFRTLDLQRLMLPLPGKVSPTATAPTVQPTDVAYVWPISANELAINTLVQQ